MLKSEKVRVGKMEKTMKNEEISQKERVLLKNLERESLKGVILEKNSEEKLEIRDQFF